MTPNTRNDIVAAVKAVADTHRELWSDCFVQERAVEAIMAGEVEPDYNDGLITDPYMALAFGAYVSTGPWWQPVEPEPERSDAWCTVSRELGDLTEQEALCVLNDLRERFGWVGAMFTRGDAEHEWTYRLPLSPGEVADEMPDDLWRAIRSTRAWGRLSDAISLVGWQYVEAAVAEALEGE